MDSDTMMSMGPQLRLPRQAAPVGRMFVGSVLTDVHSGVGPSACGLVTHTFSDNECVGTCSGIGESCKPTDWQLKFWPRHFLWSTDNFQPQFPRDFEPTACACSAPQLVPGPGKPVPPPHHALGGETEWHILQGTGSGEPYPMPPYVPPAQVIGPAD